MDKVALEFSRRYIVKKYIKIWQDFVIEERLLYWNKENMADEHNDKYVCKRMLLSYGTVPEAVSMKTLYYFYHSSISSIPLSQSLS
jgi:DNA-directed RNA polymerase subunit N (RpoN/RPB10)